MTDKNPMLSESELTGLFADARGETPPVPDALQARLIADAMAEHRDRQARAARKGWRRKVEWLAWPTGLTAACATGLLIGFSSGSEIALTLDDVLGSSVGEEIAYRLPGLAGAVTGY